MKSQYKKLGKFIREVDKRNTDGALGEDNLYGISVTKDFIVSHANLVGVTFEGYKVVETRQFAYIPDTSRRGDKIAISLNMFGEKIIVSSICSVFEITDENELLPEYLMLWFMRPEFDRYARFMSNGSAREVFDWECMCDVEIPVPPIDEQQKLVHAHQVITNRITLLTKINDKLEALLDAKYKKLFDDSTSKPRTHLETIISFSNGKARPTTLGNIPVYGGNGVLSYTDCYNAENVVLIGRVGAYCGSVYIEEKHCWVSDNAIYAKSKITNEEYFDYFLLKSLNLFEHHVGTGQQLLTQGILNALECPEFNTNDIETFNQEARPIYSSISINNKEIIKLEKLSSLVLCCLSSCIS